MMIKNRLKNNFKNRTVLKMKDGQPSPMRAIIQSGFLTYQVGRKTRRDHGPRWTKSPFAGIKNDALFLPQKYTNKTKSRYCLV